MMQAKLASSARSACADSYQNYSFQATPMNLQTSAAVSRLGGRAFCSVSPALRLSPAGSSLTGAVRSATQSAYLRGVSVFEDKLSLQPFKDVRSQLLKKEHENSRLPDVLERWGRRDASERQRGRTEQSFCVPKADIAGNGYDLSINRYKEVVHEATQHLPPKEILKKLAVLEAEIQAGMKTLEELLATH